MFEDHSSFGHWKHYENVLAGLSKYRFSSAAYTELHMEGYIFLPTIFQGNQICSLLLQAS